MSLIGSEVDVSTDTFSSRAYVSDEEEDEPSAGLESLRQSPYVAAAANDLHPPPSPPRAVERLFFSNLETQTISAAALAQQIHLSHRQFTNSLGGWSPGLTVNTDDFATASGWVTAADEENDSFFDGSITPHIVSARSDTLTLFSESDDEHSDCYKKNFFQADFLKPQTTTPTANKMSSSIISTPTIAAAPATSSDNKNKIFPTEAPQHVDAAEKVYDTAKGVWAWGKGISIVNPFLGIAETIAGKLIGMSGSDLSGVDGLVTEKLHSLDDKVLNPAIAVILGAVLGAAGKTEDVFKPFIVALLKPLGLIKTTAENPEITPVPGVTVQVQ